MMSFHYDINMFYKNLVRDLGIYGLYFDSPSCG